MALLGQEGGDQQDPPARRLAAARRVLGATHVTGFRLSEDALQITSPEPWLVRSGLHDVLAAHASHIGLLPPMAGQDGPILWVQDRLSALEAGRVTARGLWSAGLDPSRLVHVLANRPKDALWAMEEGLKAGARLVVGEVWGEPRVLDFTATRRLNMIAREAGRSCLLARLGQQEPCASGAELRWRVAPCLSAGDPYDDKTPGPPRWRLDLMRARDHPPMSWVVERELGDALTPPGLRVVPVMADRELGQAAGEGSTVLPFRARTG